jgi:hypothetical protein
VSDQNTNEACQPFSLSVNVSSQINITRKWLGLAIASLLAAGIFSLLLVMSRTPGIQSIIPWIDFFHVALVVHVDLSVLIWFLSMAACFWCLSKPDSGGKLDQFAWQLSVLGFLILVICPFFGVGKPLLNNYVPVLQHPVFYLALTLFCLGICIQALTRAVIPIGVPKKVGSELSFAIYLSVLPTLLAFMAFIASFILIPGRYQGETYFELLFWGGGHTLQFTHTLLLLVSWLWLAHACGAQIGMNRCSFAFLAVLVILPIIWVPVIYLSDSIDSGNYRLNFTALMKYGGLACLPLGLWAALSLFTMKPSTTSTKPLKAAFLASIILFTAGGVIGFLIEGVNVVIPAHYHGSIVGVTLAFMGVAYLLLPKLGLGVADSKIAAIQPYIYGGGQLLHILGLAWSGGYGVQRKTAGAAQGLDRLPEILGMGMMGLGGLISTIGGLLFLIVMIKAWQARSQT